MTSICEKRSISRGKLSEIWLESVENVKKFIELYPLFLVYNLFFWFKSSWILSSWGFAKLILDIFKYKLLFKKLHFYNNYLCLYGIHAADMYRINFLIITQELDAIMNIPVKSTIDSRPPKFFNIELTNWNK